MKAASGIYRMPLFVYVVNIYSFYSFILYFYAVLFAYIHKNMYICTHNE